MPLSPEQVRAYRTRGFFLLGRPFDAEALEEIGREYDRCIARPMQVGGERGKPFHFSPLLHLQSEVLRRHATSPRLAEAAVELLGPDVRLYWDQAVAKPPGADADVPWHQDNGYAPVEPIDYLTFTVAVDAASEENGCLWIQPGSHHDGVRPHRASGSFFYEGEAGDDPGVACPQARGEVLCFSSLTLHRTGPNRTDGWRRSWVIQLCRADTRYGDTGVLLDDRLWVARDGKPVAEPWSERPFDVQALLARDRAREGREERT